MKSILISLSLATLMGFAVKASGSAIGIAEISTIAFAAALVGWTLSQYQRPRMIELARPIRLAIHSRRQQFGSARHQRLAA